MVINGNTIRCHQAWLAWKIIELCGGYSGKRWSWWRRVAILDSSRCRISFDPSKCIWRQIVACAWSWKHISTEVSKSACRRHGHIQGVFFRSQCEALKITSAYLSTAVTRWYGIPAKPWKSSRPSSIWWPGVQQATLGLFQRHLPEMAWCICGRCLAHFFMMCLWLFMHVFIFNYLSIFMYQETCLFF